MRSAPEHLVNRIVLALLSIGVGLVSVLLRTEGGPALAAIDVDLYEVLGWIGLALAVILLMRVLGSASRRRGHRMRMKDLVVISMIGR